MPLNRTLSLPYLLSNLSKLDGSLVPLMVSDPIVGGPLLRFIVLTRSLDTGRNLLQSMAIRGLVASRQAHTTAALTSTEDQCDTVTKSHVKSVELRRGWIKMARSSEMTQTLREAKSAGRNHRGPNWTGGCFDIQEAQREDEQQHDPLRQRHNHEDDNRHRKRKDQKVRRNVKPNG